MKDIVAVERLSRAELTRLQLERLQELVARVAARVPLYRERLRQASITAKDIRAGGGSSLGCHEVCDCRCAGK